MNRSQDYWKSLPVTPRVIALLGVFFLFSTIGFSIDVVQMGRQPVLGLVLFVLLNGLFAVAYALGGTLLRKQWWKAVIPIAIAQQLVLNLVGNLIPPAPLPSQITPAYIAHMHERLSFNAYGTMAAMVLGYACLAYVLITEGRRYFRAHAEIELASEIHRTLVPTIDTRICDFEFYGRSVPSGEVGGDLIDVLGDDKGWTAYIADVSGHGVAPGVVMGMVKSAARMRLSSGERSVDLLERLNSVLCSVTRPEMFVTFAYLASNGGRLEFSTAGHPAILHYHAASNEFSEVRCSNLPLGMFDGQSFASGTVDCAPGDLLLLVTDGLLEVEDAKGEEFGLEGVKAVLSQHARDPVSAIFQELLDAARRHGRASDDQSLLLVRSHARLGSEAV